MANEKKYYWFRLKENFFDEKHIKFLRSLPDGDKLVIVYLKMQLKSLRTDGIIKYDKILPNNIDELSLILDEEQNIVKLTLGALLQSKVIEELDDGSFYMLAMQDLIGKEGESAERVRKFRRKQQQMLQCNEQVTKCNVEIEIEKEIKIEKDKKEKIKKEKKYYDDEALNNLFLEFLQLRKKIKAVNSERAINMLIKKLSNYDDETKVKMIEQSILNSWKDVYEIKQQEVKKYSNEWWDKL